MNAVRRAAGLPAALIAALALAAAAPADDLPLTPAPSWNSQDAGLAIELGEDIATTVPPTTGAAEASTVPASPEQGPLPMLGADANMSECARDLLRTRLASTVAEDDILAAMALETELLTLCRERQELVFTLHQIEAELAALQHAAAETDEGEAVAVVVPLLDQFVAPATPPVEIAGQALPLEEPPGDPAAVVPPAEETPEEDPLPALAWFSILGVKGELRAGITDGQQVWWVTEGTELPGGVTVASITGKPPEVIVAGEEATALPYQRRPGGW